MNWLCIRLQEKKNDQPLRGADIRAERTDPAEGTAVRGIRRHHKRKRTRPWKTVSGSVQKIVNNTYQHRLDGTE